LLNIGAQESTPVHQTALQLGLDFLGVERVRLFQDRKPVQFSLDSNALVFAGLEFPEQGRHLAAGQGDGSRQTLALSLDGPQALDERATLTRRIRALSQSADRLLEGGLDDIGVEQLPLEHAEYARVDLLHGQPHAVRARALSALDVDQTAVEA